MAGFWTQCACGYPGLMIYTVSFNDLCESTWSQNSIVPSLICVGTKNMRPQASPRSIGTHLGREKDYVEGNVFFPRHRGKARLNR